MSLDDMTYSIACLKMRRQYHYHHFPVSLSLSLSSFLLYLSFSLTFFLYLSDSHPSLCSIIDPCHPPSLHPFSHSIPPPWSSFFSLSAHSVHLHFLCSHGPHPLLSPSTSSLPFNSSAQLLFPTAHWDLSKLHHPDQTRPGQGRQAGRAGRQAVR